MGNSGKMFWWNEEWNRFGLASQLTADRRVRVTAIGVLVFEAAAEIAAPGRNEGPQLAPGRTRLTQSADGSGARGGKRRARLRPNPRTLSFSQEPYAWNGLF